MSNDFYLDRPTLKKLTERLRETPWITNELDIVLTRQTSYTDRTRIGGNQDGPLNYNESASEAAYQLLDTLAAWTNHIATQRNLQHPGPGRAPHYAAWLDQHIIDLALVEEAPQAFDEITDAWKTAKQTIDRPRPLEFAGHCPNSDPNNPCPPIYVKPSTRNTHCRNCGHNCDVEQMRDQLRKQIRGRQYTSTELTTALTICTGTEVSSERIRNWMRRHQLTPTGYTSRGVELYSLDEALDLYHRTPPRRHRNAS